MRKMLLLRLLESEHRLDEAYRLLGHIMATLTAGHPLPHCEFGEGLAEIASVIEEQMCILFSEDDVDCGSSRNLCS